MSAGRPGLRVLIRALLLAGFAVALAGCDRCGHVDFTLHPQGPKACTRG